MNSDESHGEETDLDGRNRGQTTWANGDGPELQVLSPRSIVNDDYTDSEGSPLLGNEHGSAQGDSGNSSSEHDWVGSADYEGLTWRHRPSIYWLLPPFFFFALAFGGIAVPRLNLILSLVCRQYLADKALADPTFTFTPVLSGGDNPQCREPEVQALATKFQLYLSLIAGTLSAIVSPKLGALSDRYGRIRILIITSVGGFVTEIITICAGTYPDRIHYTWLLVGHAFEGLCGSFTAGMALTHAYASDCTHPQKRAVAFGYFHACLFSGIAIGPFLAAFAYEATGSLLTMFYVAIVVHTCFILFIGFVVPESLTKKRQLHARERYLAEGDSTSWDRYSCLWAFRKGNFFAPLKILWPTGRGSSNRLRGNLILLAAIDTIIFGTAMGSMAVIVYYLGFQFEWDTFKTNIFVSIANTTRVSCLLIVLPTINYIFRTRPRNKQRREFGFVIPERNTGSDSLDLHIIRLSVFMEILGYGGYAIVRTGPLFILSGMFAALGGMGSPTLQAALTKHVPHDRVGQLLGATGLLHALARIVAPTICNLIYASTVGTFPQAVFVVLFAGFVVAFLFSWFVKPNVYLEHPSETTGDRPISQDRAQDNTDALIDEEIVGV